MKDEALMPLEPGANVRVLAGGVLVEDDMDDLTGRHLGFDRIPNTDGLLMPMALHNAADDVAGENVQGGEENASPRHRERPNSSSVKDQDKVLLEAKTPCRNLV